MRLSAAGLSRGCRLLPAVEAPSGPVPLLGKDTASAMRSGLLNGYIGSVESMTRRFLDLSEKGCRAVITGGEAPLVREHSSLFHVHDPDLLFKGIALAFGASMKRETGP